MVKTHIEIHMVMSLDEAAVLESHLEDLPITHPTTPHYDALHALLAYARERLDV